MCRRYDGRLQLAFMCAVYLYQVSELALDIDHSTIERPLKETFESYFQLTKLIKHII